MTVQREQPVKSGTTTYKSSVEQRLANAGFALPTIQANGSYVVARKHKDMVWTAGQLSRTDQGVVTGRACDIDDLPAAKKACEVAVLRAIAAVATVASLDSVSQVLILRGFIAADQRFEQHSQALDAASEILKLAFGADRASCVRSAIGAASLPSGGLAELELTVALVQ